MRINNFTWLWVAAIAACLVGAEIYAQPPGGRGGREGRGPGGRFGFMRMLPVMAALDADADGELSAEEISRAVAALKTLDKNKDGKLTQEELQPDFGGRGGFGGPGGGRGGFGGPSGGPNAEQVVARWMEMDKNGDKKLAKDEVPEQMHTAFARADANQDNELDKDEISKMAEQMATRGGRGGFGNRGGRGGEEGGRPRRPQRPE